MRHILGSFFIKKTRADYNAIASSFSETREKPWKDWKHIRPYFHSNLSVLDIGCGNGRLCEHIPYKTYHGVDISEELIGIAQKKYGNKSHTTFSLGSFSSLPGQTYDLIVSIAAFHHLPSKPLRTEALENIKKHLKKNGICIISVWDLSSTHYQNEKRKARVRALLTLGLFSPRDLFIPWKRGEKKRMRYYYAFTLDEMETLLNGAGFHIKEVIRTDNLYFVCTPTLRRMK